MHVTTCLYKHFILQNLEVLNKENSLESNHSDEQDNLTIVITTAGEIGVVDLVNHLHVTRSPQTENSNFNIYLLTASSDSPNFPYQTQLLLPLNYV